MLHALHRSRSPLFRLLLVGALLLAGLHATSAAPARYDAAVDITFPAVADARFGDDYASGRSGGRSHRATDLFGPMGSPVYAAMGGRVSWMPGRHGTAGYALHVRGDDGRVYAYYHLGPHSGTAAQAYAPGIAEGVNVTRGQHIGFLGDSGNAAGGTPHLHFEIHDDRVADPHGGNRLNPFASLAAAARRGDVGGGRTGAAPAASRAGSREPILRVGDRGPAVATWQAQLNSVIGAGLATDGVFGPATDQATRAFQRTRGLTVDGIVGPASRGALGAAVTASPVAPTSSAVETVTNGSAILRRGDRGPAVATWQGQLNGATNAGLATDGIFGPATEEATRAFQRARGLLVDGIVGPQSRGALGG